MRVLIVITVVGLLLRSGVVLLLSGELTHDRDAYLAIARSVAAGRGYSSVPRGEPTAYRPPTYPLLLAPGVAALGEPAGVALLNLLTGVLTVWITYRLGRRLELGRGALVAAGLVAVDPLLLQYSAQPMTEVLSACLVVAFAGVLTAWGRRPETSGRGRGANAWRALLAGLLFGAAALCRPTVWLAGVLLVAWWVWRVVRGPSARTAGDASVGASGSRLGGRWLPALCCATGVALVVAPWAVRNRLVFGRPIVTTTHGGYTLLLGNNPVFYREVVDRPWGTTWSGESLAQWNASLEADMRREQPAVRGEVARDRWMYARAWQHMREEPGTFVRACWLRFRRFWNIAPLESAELIEQSWRQLCGVVGWPGGAGAAKTAAALVRWTVAAFYVAVTAAMLAGLVRLGRDEWRWWMPVVLLIAAFCLAHLAYWTDTRMRAPVVPLIALVAARGVRWAGPRHCRD